MNTTAITRPKISLVDEEKYVNSFYELGLYFIGKFPKFFARMMKIDSGQFKLRTSSEKYDNPSARVFDGKDDNFIKTVCSTMFFGWSSHQFDSHISIQILEKVNVGICFAHKMNDNDQATIYFYDHSLSGLRMPGQKQDEDYDPSVLNKSAEKFFRDTIGFSNTKTISAEEGINALEKVLEKIESSL